jgi:GTP cyclohydrolase II
MTIVSASMFNDEQFKEEHSLMIADDEVRVVVRQPRYRRGERHPACAFVFGEPSDDCLVRIHSRCLYGDVFGSRECDCAGQLHTAMDMMRASGSGVLIYLDQEGRGAGLFAKARALRMRQESGMDSFRSYAHYGLPPDSRSYVIAADLLADLGLKRVKLLTNNWEKVAGLEARGIKVEREPLIVPVSDHALPYIESKRAQGQDMGPLPPLPPLEPSLEGARP